DHGLVAHLRAAQSLHGVDGGLQRGDDPGTVGGLLIVEDTARRGQSRAPESTGGPARRFRPGTTGSHQNGPGTRTAVECRTGRFDGSACSVDHALAVVAVTGDGIELAEVL